jgi:hypothetical protein
MKTQPTASKLLVQISEKMKRDTFSITIFSAQFSDNIACIKIKIKYTINKVLIMQSLERYDSKDQGEQLSPEDLRSCGKLNKGTKRHMPMLKNMYETMT